MKSASPEIILLMIPTKIAQNSFFLAILRPIFIEDKGAELSREIARWANVKEIDQTSIKIRSVKIIIGIINTEIIFAIASMTSKVIIKPIGMMISEVRAINLAIGFIFGKESWEIWASVNFCPSKAFCVPIIVETFAKAPLR